MPISKTAVLTDSACDLPQDLAEKAGVDILCFEINVDGKSYVEREDFTFEEYYDILRTCKDIPKTAQVTTFRFYEQFLKYDDEDVEQVLYVSINSTGSSTFSAAQMAERQFRTERPNSKMTINLVDSHTYSLGYGYFVAEAANKLKNNAEMRNVVEWLNDVFSRVEIVLAAYSLRFMKKSGRISAVAAFAGELLGLRPCITLNDGVSTVRSTVRGDGKVLPALLEYANKHIDETKEFMIVGTNDQNIADLANHCKKRWKTEPLILGKLGSAVSTNTGPDAVAIVYLGDKRTR